jgi:hypothetical protein
MHRVAVAEPAMRVTARASGRGGLVNAVMWSLLLVEIDEKTKGF